VEYDGFVSGMFRRGAPRHSRLSETFRLAQSTIRIAVHLQVTRTAACGHNRLSRTMQYDKVAIGTWNVDGFTIEHVFREHNTAADALASIAQRR